MEIKVPSLGESIAEVEIGQWLVKEGDLVKKDQNLVSIESEKATMELPASVAGGLVKIVKPKGSVVKIGEVIAVIDPEAKAGTVAVPAQEAAAPAPTATQTRVMPAAERLMAESGVNPSTVLPSGPGGRILKEDVQRAIETQPKTFTSSAPTAVPAPAPAVAATKSKGPRAEEIVPMTRMRRTVASRLVEAQQTAALLTTFNEVDLSAVMALRKEYQDAFTAKYGTKLGFMSFFVKASIDALRLYPQVNAEIRGHDIVYHHYHDIGVAVGGGKGLVVPVLRNAERMSFAEIELAITDFGKRAKDNKLTLEELQGGTFTISNGGVYGSMLSTPIVNPPQSGILGMHAIQDRPVAREGQVVIRPMMYLALTYDHRIVDGREGVSFLKRIKEVLENPARLLLEV